MKTLQFVPRFQSNIRDVSYLAEAAQLFIPSSLRYNDSLKIYFQINTALQIHLQIVAENASKNVIEIVEVINNRGQTLDRKALLDIPGLNMVLKQVVVEKDNPKDQHNLLSNADLVIVQNLSTDDCVSKNHVPYNNTKKAIYILIINTKYTCLIK